MSNHQNGNDAESCSVLICYSTHSVPFCPSGVEIAFRAQDTSDKFLQCDGEYINFKYTWTARDLLITSKTRKHGYHYISHSTIAASSFY